jgi:hypothetical protein
MRLSWALLLLSGCWPFLPGPFDDYVDGDSEGTGDVDTGEGTEADTEADTDPDTEPDTDPDTEPDTDPDTAPDTDPDTDPSTVLNVTINQLRTGQVAQGTRIRVSGVRVTTPQTPNGFWIQADLPGQDQGIYVYDGTTDVASVAIGDRVAVTGDYIEFASGSGSLSEVFVSETDAVVVTGVINTERVSDLAHVTLSLSSTAEGYESTLVSLGPSEVVSGPDNFGVFIVEPIGGGAQVNVDDVFYNDAPQIGDQYDSITGVLDFSFGLFKIQPRFSLDLPPFSGTGGCPAALCVDDLLPGDVIITEVGFNPSNTMGFDDFNEYVEVYNQSGVSVNLDGLLIQDTSTESVVTSDVVIANNSYAVFFRGDNPDWGWGAFGIDRDGSYTDVVAFSNSTGEQAFILQPLGLEPLAESQAYPGGQVGRAWNLDPRSFGNPGNANAWCYSTTFVGSMDRATPGLANDACSNFFP